jgi:hypothetical protein
MERKKEIQKEKTMMDDAFPVNTFCEELKIMDW